MVKQVKKKMKIKNSVDEYNMFLSQIKVLDDLIVDLCWRVAEFLQGEMCTLDGAGSGDLIKTYWVRESSRTCLIGRFLKLKEGEFL